MNKSNPKTGDSKTGDNLTAQDRMSKLRAGMQGYAQPAEPELPLPPVDTIEPPAPVPDPEPFPDLVELPVQSLPNGLLDRIPHTQAVEAERFKSRPWRQLPDESAIEYAIFKEYLELPLASGRDLDTLAQKLTGPDTTDWFPALLNILPVPDYVIEGHGNTKTGRPSKKSSVAPPIDSSAESRMLWWLANRNYWIERSQQFDAWQMESFAEARRLQVQDLAKQLHTEYLNHSMEQIAFLSEIRRGLLKHVSVDGRLRKIRREQSGLAPVGPNGTDMELVEVTEWDPFAQIDAAHRISDRLFGPLPSMLDGEVTTVLDQSLNTPQNALAGNQPASIPEKKKGNASWLTERMNKVQDSLNAAELKKDLNVS